MSACVLAASGCDGDPPPRAAEVERADTPADSNSPPSGQLAQGSGAPAAQDDTPLIDSSIPPAVAGEDGWGYRQSATADLTGDGTEERVVLTARVEIYRGRPAWDDGQPWQVYVEAADGTRTYIYARQLQLGTLTMRVTRPGAAGAATIVLLEHLPDRLSLYEASYAGPGRVQVETAFRRDVDPRGDTASPDLP